MKHIFILWSIILLISSSMASFADEQFSVSPPSLDLTLDDGEKIIEEVSLTVNIICVVAFDVDVVASDPSVLVRNLTGVDTNGCGGDTSTFEIEFTGAAMPMQFDLQFVGSGSILATIPVTISPKPALEALHGVLFGKNGIIFQVPSSGCTQKSDFDVIIQESYPLQLRLDRIHPDVCDAYLPLGKRIFFSYHELGLVSGSEVRVVNPLGKTVVPFRQYR
jgi:hypothetical protein